MRQRLTVTLLALLFLAPAAFAQKSFFNFYADLDANQVVPPTSSPATGIGEITLDLGTNRIKYRVMTTCVGPIPVLQFGIGAEGEPGTVFFELNRGVYDMYEGTTPVLTAEQIGALFQEQVYVAISTSFPFPGVIEIRGQLRASIKRPYAGDFGEAAVVPPTGSSATGRGWFHLNQPENTLTYDLEVSGMQATAAQLRIGPDGDNGTVLADLDGTGNRFCGTTPKLDSATIDSILLDGTYISIESAAFPNGEVRTQVVPVPQIQLVSYLRGAEVVPSHITSANGLARFNLDTTTKILSYDIEVRDMNATRLEIGLGYPDQPTVRSARLPGGPTLWSGQVGPLNDNVIDLLLSLAINITVKSDEFPDGQIRGAPQTNPYIYGFGSDAGFGGVAERLQIGRRNAHVAGSTEWTATLRNAPPGAVARLVVGESNVSFQGQAIPFDLNVGIGAARSFLWMNPANSHRFTRTVDDAGCASVTISVPDAATSIGDVGYYQWIVFAGTTPSNMSVSDLMEVIIQ